MSQILRPFQPNGAAPPAPGPSAIYTHPDDVIADPNLTATKKKEVLASWISDARAVENAPALRQLECGSVVAVDAILQALVSLDEPASGRPDEPARPPHWRQRRRPIGRWARRTGERKSANDNDDDPPPAPAGFGIPFRPIFVAAHAAALAQPRKAAVA